MFTHAITRTPASSFANGLTTARLGPPDLETMLHQHRAYVAALESCGLVVTVLDPDTSFPDGHFVEDTAVVLDQVAVIANPGAAERKGEESAIAEVLRDYRPLERIRPPASLDGGDVLEVGRHLFIGVSQRTNLEGAEQLGAIAVRCGYSWTAVEVAGGLHLKSGVNHVGEGRLLLTREYADAPEFADRPRVVVPDDEAYASNTLLVNQVLIVPAGYPRTRDALSRLGTAIIELDMSEARKMDGGLTCLSLRFSATEPLEQSRSRRTEHA